MDNILKFEPEVIVAKQEWRTLHGRIKQNWRSLESKRRVAFRMYILEKIGLGLFSGVDCSLGRLILNISEDVSYEQAYNQMKAKLLKHLKSQLLKGGPTHFLDVDEMLNFSELALLVPRILELRKVEMENVMLSRKNQFIDLLPLWATAYGFKILMSLKMKRRVDVIGLTRVIEEVKAAGFDLHIGEEDNVHDFISPMSKDMKDYLVFVSENPSQFGGLGRPPIMSPEVTPSILANIPECLRKTLTESAGRQSRNKSILISSNSLANRFILDKWGIRPSQRRRFRSLFSTIRKQCRTIFQHYLSRGRLEWSEGGQIQIYGVYKFDAIRGNLILGFVSVDPNSSWTLPP